MREGIIGRLSRRRFLKLTGQTSAFVLLAPPLKLMADTGTATQAVVRDELGVAANQAGATGYTLELLNIAQITDVHITNVNGPLRLENLKWFGVSPANLAQLDAVIDSVVRDQSDLSCQNWDAVIRSINLQHRQKPMDFVICTGDHTDTDTEEELTLFIEIADGMKSQTFTRLAAEGAIRQDFTPEGLQLPWYVTLGNHDVEYIGTFNSQGLLFNILAPFLGAWPYLEQLSSKSETIEKYRIARDNPGPYWHGLENQPYQAFQDWQGYYSFTPKPSVHCIVLNTANFTAYDPSDSDPYNGNEQPKETFSLGVLDRTQYDWMVSEIEANPDKLCLIFSHHSPVPNAETGTGTSFMDAQSDITAAELRQTLCQYPNVIAHINGHSHINAIAAVKEGETGGYWNINTCALIEWPMEWRNIAVRDNGDGTGAIVCRMVRHANTDILEVAGGDPAADKEYREGTEQDRDVELVFAIPAAVKETILKNLPEEPVTPEANEDGSDGNGGGSDSDSRCFVATATYGTAMASEVMSLRRYRDAVLKPHPLGRALVALYYRLSPPVAALIAKRPALRALARGLLQPVIRLLQRRGF